MSVTLLNPDGTEVDITPESKRLFLEFHFDNDWCRLQLAKENGAFPDEVAFEKANNALYAKYGRTKPKRKGDDT